jgi:hypothetical protein
MSLSRFKSFAASLTARYYFSAETASTDCLKAVTKVLLNYR